MQYTNAKVVSNVTLNMGRIANCSYSTKVVAMEFGIIVSEGALTIRQVSISVPSPFTSSAWDMVPFLMRPQEGIKVKNGQRVLRLNQVKVTTTTKNNIHSAPPALEHLKNIWDGASRVKDNRFARGLHLLFGSGHKDSKLIKDHVCHSLCWHLLRKIDNTPTICIYTIRYSWHMSLSITF